MDVSSAIGRLGGRRRYRSRGVEEEYRNTALWEHHCRRRVTTWKKSMKQQEDREKSINRANERGRSPTDATNGADIYTTPMTAPSGCHYLRWFGTDRSMQPILTTPCPPPDSTQTNGIFSPGSGPPAGTVKVDTPVLDTNKADQFKRWLSTKHAMSTLP